MNLNSGYIVIDAPCVPSAIEMFFKEQPICEKHLIPLVKFTLHKYEKTHFFSTYIGRYF